MTCVIGMIRGNDVWMAGDSLGSNGYTKNTYAIPKVFKAHSTNDFLIGIAGTFNTQILNYIPLFDELDYLKGKIDREYLITQLPLTLMSIQKTYDPYNKSAFTIMMGYQNQLFLTQSDLSVLCIAEDFCCLGSGAEVAKGAMESLLRLDEEQKLEPQEILFQALDIAQKYIPSVQEPFLCINTRTNEVLMYEQGEYYSLNPTPEEKQSEEKPKETPKEVKSSIKIETPEEDGVEKDNSTEDDLFEEEDTDEE